MWSRSWAQPAIGGLVIVLSVMAGGCSGDDGGESSADISPLEEYFGEDSITYSGAGMSFSYGGQDIEPTEPTEEDLQLRRDFEDAVAVCMAGRGFEYVPNVIMPDDYDAGPWEEAYALPDDEFTEKYGYGVSTLNFTTADGDLAEADPNQEIRAGLSPQAQKEYDEALYGQGGGEVVSGQGSSTDPAAAPSQAPTDALDGAHEPTAEDLGCYGVARKKIYVAAASDDEDPFADFEALFDEVFQLGQRLRGDPRVEAAIGDWTSCMADAGYPEFEQIGEPEQQVWQRWNELMGRSQASPEPAEGEEFQQYELDLARADQACLDEHYTEVATDVRYELETEFVRQHRAELERFRDAIAEFESSGGVGGNG